MEKPNDKDYDFNDPFEILTFTKKMTEYAHYMAHRLRPQDIFENKIKNKLLIRGFPIKTIENNRGLIGAVIDETILEAIKNK